MDIFKENDNFTVSEDINGPLLAVAVSIEFFLALIINLFILSFSLCHLKALKQPSIIFLTNFIVANLAITFFVMPFTVITAFAGEWVFGTSAEERNRSCQFSGFAFAFSFEVIVQTFTMVSVDRFLFIVKPFFHKRFMKTSVALALVLFLWIFSGLLSMTSFVGLGQFAFNQFTATCQQVYLGVEHRGYRIFSTFIGLIRMTIIIVTSLWTFCFTKKFIKGLRMKDQNSTTQDHVYMVRMRKIIGMFGLMLIVGVMTFVPGLLVAISGLIMGKDKLPAQVFPITVVSILFNVVMNPVIQLYFRKDLNDYVARHWKMLVKHCIVFLDSRKFNEEVTSKTG